MCYKSITYNTFLKCNNFYNISVEGWVKCLFEGKKGFIVVVYYQFLLA